MSEVSTLAYFYPQTTSCPERTERAQNLGYTLANESELIQNATQLFDEHDQPRTYCLGDLDSMVWDDSTSEAISKQIDLAKQYGVDGFIFDTYGGIREGRPVRESRKPLEVFSDLKQSRENFHFALMWVMSGPRVVIPVPHATSMVREPGQAYECSPETARLIVDDSIEYWTDSNYLHVDGRPYCSVMPSTFERHEVSRDAINFFDEIRSYAEQQYGISPYLVGIERREDYYANLYRRVGMDAITAYALLPDFEKGSSPLQSYAERRDKVSSSWHRMRDNGLNFTPPAVVGWDASPRGAAGALLADVACKYPFTPILTGATPVEYETMLKEALNFAAANPMAGESVVPICAFNEVGESCALLPRVVDGEIDFQFLEATRRAIDTAKINNRATI